MENSGKMSKGRVLMGMSGGIDSTAACLMLQEQGYEVVGVTMRVFDLASQLDAGGEPRFIVEAREVASRLGIEHHVADEREGFRESIVRYFTDEYMQGRTPNPCVMCNPLFKFRVLTEWADRLGCDHVATGHYVRVEREGQHCYIVTGDDPQKDQSYFLWNLSQEVLARCVFPLGGWKKPDVRQYLDDKGFALKAREGESMEVCFIEGDYRDFLREHCPQIDEQIGQGKFVDSAGRTIGMHQGYPYYTIGQRKGLNIGGHKESIFVIDTNIEDNIIYVGEGHHHPGLLRKALKISNDEVHWIREDLKMAVGEKRSYALRIRYRQPLQRATLYQMEGYLYVVFSEHQRGISAGQFAAWYGEDGEMIGSGVIDL
jgi:tRNA-specific 2-thiouridylase